MSFAELQKSNYKRNEKSFTIKLGEKDLSFKAIELNHFQKIEIEGLRANGLEWLTKFVSYSIVDGNGAKMTEAQASGLDAEYVNVFIAEALEVNKFEVPTEDSSEGNKKK